MHIFVYVYNIAACNKLTTVHTIGPGVEECTVTYSETQKSGGPRPRAARKNVRKRERKKEREKEREKVQAV